MLYALLMHAIILFFMDAVVRLFTYCATGTTAYRNGAFLEGGGTTVKQGSVTH
jgi:hypothetical protein